MEEDGVAAPSIDVLPSRINAEERAVPKEGLSSWGNPSLAVLRRLSVYFLADFFATTTSGVERRWRMVAALR